MKTVLSNHSKTKAIKLATVERTKVRRRRPQKARKAEKLSHRPSSNGKTKSGEYVLNRPPKKPGGGEVYNNNRAITISCETSSEQENSHNTITNMLGKTEVLDIIRIGKVNNQDKKGHYLGDLRMRTRHKNKRKNKVRLHLLGF